LQQLLNAVRSGGIDTVVVYKVDRLTRSLADFAKLVDLFHAHDVAFVSVTQSLNTTSSMGRLTLNVLLSFAQVETAITEAFPWEKIELRERIARITLHRYRLAVEPKKTEDTPPIEPMSIPFIWQPQGRRKRHHP